MDYDRMKRVIYENIDVSVTANTLDNRVVQWVKYGTEELETCGKNE